MLYVFVNNLVQILKTVPYLEVPMCVCMFLDD